MQNSGFQKLCKFLQSAKALLPINLIFGIEILLNFVQLENADIDTVSTDGNFTFVNAQFAKAERPILLTFGIYTFSRFLHAENARFPIPKILGIETLLIFVLLNALIPRMYKTFLPFIVSGLFTSSYCTSTGRYL